LTRDIISFEGVKDSADKNDTAYWIYSFASMLVPFLFFTAALVFQKMNDPAAFNALRPGAAPAADAGFSAATRILLAVGFGCSLGISLNIVKMKKFSKQGMLEYLAFLTNGIPLIGIMYALFRMH
jgi:hypothetical protein